MQDSELWLIEEQLWTAGSAFYEQRLDAGALMVLPSLGVLDRASVIEVVRQRPCSRRAALDDRLSFLPSQDVAVLAYTAHATKREGSHSHSRCKSTYLRIEGVWKLVMHQQARVADAPDEPAEFLNSAMGRMAARVLGPILRRQGQHAATEGLVQAPPARSRPRREH